MSLEENAHIPMAGIREGGAGGRTVSPRPSQFSDSDLLRNF